LFCVAALVATSAAHALPIVGTSYGGFSNVSSCDSSGSDRDCRIVDTSNGSNTQVQWGSQSFYSDFVNPSKLTSVDLNINTDTNSSLGVQIGRLDWYNSATIAVDDLDVLSVAWTLSLKFTSPNGPDPNGSELFNLTIKNPLNPPGDLVYGLELVDLTNLDNSIDLAGVSITNLRYVAVDGSGGGTTYFSNNVWYNDENNNASLYILADFLPRTAAKVQEPASLALIGFGALVAAGFMRRRKRIV
jgi:hypothetical protein